MCNIVILQENKGRVPKVLDVELLDDLVNICMPGDDITLTGIIKVFFKKHFYKYLLHSTIVFLHLYHKH